MRSLHLSFASLITVARVTSGRNPLSAALAATAQAIGGLAMVSCVCLCFCVLPSAVEITSAPDHSTEEQQDPPTFFLFSSTSILILIISPFPSRLFLILVIFPLPPYFSIFVPSLVPIPPSSCTVAFQISLPQLNFSRPSPIPLLSRFRVSRDIKASPLPRPSELH